MEKLYIMLDEEDKFLWTFKWDKENSTWQPPDGLRAVEKEEWEQRASKTIENASPKTEFTAKDWMDREGFNATVLVALERLQKQLEKVGGESTKLKAIEKWADSIMLIYSTGTIKKEFWPQAPFKVEEVFEDVARVLTEKSSSEDWWSKLIHENH